MEFKKKSLYVTQDGVQGSREPNDLRLCMDQKKRCHVFDDISLRIYNSRDEIGVENTSHTSMFTMVTLMVMDFMTIAKTTILDEGNAGKFELFRSAMRNVFAFLFSGS